MTMKGTARRRQSHCVAEQRTNRVERAEEHTIVQHPAEERNLANIQEVLPFSYTTYQDK